MSISTLKGSRVDVRLWTPLTEVESSALDQLRNLAALPWVFHHVAAKRSFNLAQVVAQTAGSSAARMQACSTRSPVRTRTSSR